MYFSVEMYLHDFSPTALCSLSSCVLQPEFVLFKEKKTWREAQSFCREDCLDLATIEDLGDIETVLRSVEGQYDDAVWKGEQRWHWSITEKDFYKKGERDYFIWDIQKDTGFNCLQQRDTVCQRVHHHTTFNLL